MQKKYLHVSQIPVSNSSLESYLNMYLAETAFPQNLEKLEIFDFIFSVFWSIFSLKSINQFIIHPPKNAKITGL